MNAGSGGSGGRAPVDSGDDAGREIAEADIIQLQGTRLYAMSRSGGLSVIDVSDPGALRILGRYRTSFTPFEMYVRDGIVFAMYSDWGEYVEQTDAAGVSSWVWKQTSALLALDVADPAAIRKVGAFDLPGQISDSRLVGDVLYTVSYQNGACWDCASKPTTSIVSVDVAQPNAPRKVDQLEFEDPGNEYGFGPRSITVTSERIYIAGPEYGSVEPENSTIQVVDIADPGGDLVAGTTVQVRGQITSRWQMDEYQGTLRVISQPWTWWGSSVPPSLETFTVTSSQDIQPLAHLDLVLPRPEMLQSVRFDGERGYAVTFERTDPLFTFDLSDPAAPVQRGELEIPGFLYHMEPRGNRLIGLGYDQGNSEGAITVSLFDVTDIAAPTMIERVNFGGTWASLPEDQDRIHKAFEIDPENGLMLVPFQGWQPVDDASWCGRSLNGVQLVDFQGDDLALRGMTHSLGQARRAFVASGTLFTVAEQEVAAYDIADRDQPAVISAAPLALNVSMTLPTGDRLVRLRQDWYSDDMRLEVVSKAASESLVAETTLNLTEYLRERHGLATCSYWYPSNQPLFMVGDVAWTIINDYGNWDANVGYANGRALLVGFSPETGAITGSLEVPFRPGYWGWGETSRVVRGNAVYLMQEGWEQDEARRTLATLDLSDPEAPRLAASTEIPTSDYSGSTGLLTSGTELVTSYARAVPDRPDAVRHFLVRIDVENALEPRVLGAYNVPGYVVDYDAADATAVTLDHQPIQAPGTSYEDCAQKLPGAWFDPTTSLCRGHSATLHRVRIANGGVNVLRSVRNDALNWATPRRADGRLFFTGGYYGYYGYAVDGYYGYGGGPWASQDIVVVDSRSLAQGTVEAPGVWNVLPVGQSLLLAPSAGQPLSLVDATDVENPVLRSGAEKALGYTLHLAVSGRDVFVAQGDGGVQRMTLP